MSLPFLKPNYNLLLRSEMPKIIALSLFPFLLFGDIFEVVLSTQENVKPLYICAAHSEEKKEYLDRLRSVLTFDINCGGAIEVAPFTLDQELSLFPFQKEHWDSFCYMLSMEAFDKNLLFSLIDVEKEKVKTYPPIPLTENLTIDRYLIHRFSDQLHQELFSIQGIASKKILYTQRAHNLNGKEPSWHSEVWICDSDGANAKQLTHTHGYCLSPGFLSTQEFFYVFHDKGQSKIYRAFLNHPEENQLLLSMRGNQLLPAVAKSGLHLAFIADVTGKPDLFLQQLDTKKKPLGKPRQLYSAPRATQASPTFSPDGKEIAFVSDKDGTPRIYLLNWKNPESQPKLLTKKFRDNSSPCWSADGKKLAYAAKVDGVRQICVYDFEKEEETQMTTGFETKENPSWAPNSLHLLYNTEGDLSELYLLPPHAKEPICITSGPGQKRFGSWSIQ